MVSCQLAVNVQFKGFKEINQGFLSVKRYYFTSYSMRPFREERLKLEQLLLNSNVVVSIKVSLSPTVKSVPLCCRKYVQPTQMKLLKERKIKRNGE